MTRQISPGRLVVAAVIALVGCLIIWVVVPYNNFLFNNTYLADSFLPEIVIGLTLVLVLGVNPVLRLIRPQWMLNRRQLALVVSLLLFAAVIPSNGLMRMFPRLVAESNQDLHTSVTTSQIATDAGFRPELFPDPLPARGDDGRVKTFDTPVSDQFLDELAPGNTIPWSAWVTPMAVWGLLILSMWMLMVGLAGVVFPQWRDRERLPFPLLNVYHGLTGSPDEPGGRVLPAVFRSRLFWVACLSVFFIHGLRGLHTFTGAVPSFPLNWELGDYFSDSVFRQAPLALKRQAIFFMLIGVAYFIPNRYSVSVWGWVAAYSLYITFGRAYVPAFNDGQVYDQAFGMLLAIAVWVLWLGRAHWVLVGRAMLGSVRGTPDSRRDRIAGWTFAIGSAGMVCWLYWAGCELWFSLLATLACAVISLLMARIVAETGVPMLWLGRITAAGFAAMFPMAWQSPHTLFFSSALYALVTRTSAVSAAVMATLALGMDPKASPAHHSRLMVGGLAVLAIGFVIGGAVHLNMGYHNAAVTTDAKGGISTINDWPRTQRSSYEFFDGDRGHQIAGFAGGTALLWACSRFPSWPVHPVGIVFCQNSIGNLIWFSFLLGWLAKVTVTSLFGGGAYRKARPVFLGLILGELFAVIVWAVVPVAIVLWTGVDPAELPRYSLIQYP